MPQYEGSCHCGAVAWTVEVPEDAQQHILCHCGACQSQSGGDYTLNQIVGKEAFKLTKGDLKVYTYKGDSGNPTDCYFCGNCTSSPYHHQHVLGPDKIILRTGLLKNAKAWKKPDTEIYGIDKNTWQPAIGGTLFKTGPGTETM